MQRQNTPYARQLSSVKLSSSTSRVPDRSLLHQSQHFNEALTYNQAVHTAPYVQNNYNYQTPLTRKIPSATKSNRPMLYNSTAGFSNYSIVHDILDHLSMLPDQGEVNKVKENFRNVQKPPAENWSNNPNNNFPSNIVNNNQFSANKSTEIKSRTLQPETYSNLNNSLMSVSSMVNSGGNESSNGKINENFTPLVTQKGIKAKMQQNTSTHSQSTRLNISKNKSLNERIRLFTGTAEKVIKWHRIYDKNYFCYYEVIASIISIQEGSVPMQKIMLLRDKKGPIIQVVHYSQDHINIENFCVGQMLRCVGRMVGPNIMHGLSIRQATNGEITTLQRMCYICDHAITKSLEKN